MEQFLNRAQESSITKMKSLAPAVLRIGLSLVFLWFGTQQILHTDMWTSLIPASLVSISGISASFWVNFNGAFEIVFGICFLFGYFTRITALLLALHMFDITFVVGYSSVGIRDFGLAVATLSAFLHGVDVWSLDKFRENKQSA